MEEKLRYLSGTTSYQTIYAVGSKDPSGLFNVVPSQTSGTLVHQKFNKTILSNREYSIKVLQEKSSDLFKKGETHKQIAYNNAIESLLVLSDDHFDSLLGENKLTEIKGIGLKLSGLIENIVQYNDKSVQETILSQPLIEEYAPENIIVDTPEEILKQIKIRMAFEKKEYRFILKPHIPMRGLLKTLHDNKIKSVLENQRDILLLTTFR